MHHPHEHNLVFRTIIITTGGQASVEKVTRDEGSGTEPRDGLKRRGTREQKIGDKGTRDEGSRREPRDRHKRREIRAQEIGIRVQEIGIRVQEVGIREQEMRDQGESRGTDTREEGQGNKR